MKKIDYIINEIKNNKGLFDEDTGFKKFLEEMPEEFRNNLTNILSNENLLCQQLEMLPDELQSQLSDVIISITSVPEEALALYNQCRYLEARELLRKTLVIYQDKTMVMNDQFEQAIDFVFQRIQSLTYNLLGDVEKVLGHLSDAEECYFKALELAQPLGDIDTIVKALHGIGLYLWESGDLEGSKEYFHEALKIIEGQPDRWHSHSKILTGLSCIYAEIGQSDEAESYALQAIDLCRGINDRQHLPSCLNNLACLHLEWLTFNDALGWLEEALDIALDNNQHDTVALIMGNLAMTYLLITATNEDAEQAECFLIRAEEGFKTALEKSRIIGNIKLEARNIGNMGYLHQIKEEYEKATDAFSKATQMFHDIGVKAEEAQYLSALANHLRLNIGDQEHAFQAGKAAIGILEKIRGGLKKQHHRISYAAEVTSPYETTIMCLIDLGRIEEALEYMERAKSRTLLELLSARIMQHSIMKTDSELFQRAIQLLVEMDEIRRNLDDAASGEMSSGDEPDNSESRAGKVDIRDLSQSLLEMMENKEREFSGIAADIQNDFPETADLWTVVPTNADKIRNFIDNDTCLLEMFQTEKQLYLIGISRNETAQLLCVDISVHDAVNTVIGMLDAIQDPSFRETKSHDYIRYIQQPMSKMYEVMISPIAGWLQNHKRCLIIPHLCWHYFPFYILFDNGKKEFLCDQIEIGFCPSSSILQQCKQKNRLKRDNAILMARHDGDLLMADDEVRLLAASFLPGTAHVYTGRNAYLNRAADNELFDVIHLACHGWFDSDNPFFSGIAIPPEKDDERYTSLLDLFNLQMPCTQITLSACESGLSNFTVADELTGLSRALFGAGAASLLLSLWKVADESTLYLMQNYYWHFVANKQCKTRALQLAMQAVKARPEYAHPYYWAPFVLMGDWR